MPMRRLLANQQKQSKKPYTKQLINRERLVFTVFTEKRSQTATLLILGFKVASLILVMR